MHLHLHLHLYLQLNSSIDLFAERFRVLIRFTFFTRMNMELIIPFLLPFAVALTIELFGS